MIFEPTSLTPTITKIGKDVGGALVKGIGEAIAEDPTVGALLGAIVGGKFGGVPGAFLGLTTGYTVTNGNKVLKEEGIDMKASDFNEWRGGTGQFFWNNDKYKEAKEKADGSHSAGLEYVPFNGYRAELHKGEKVLTRSEADKERKGGNGNTYNFSITMNGTGNTEQDANRLFEVFVNKLELAGLGGA